ncbi:hypothetical protein KO498_11365 [Lentibacter algarum]|uniref:hypothetical protein n=1 Tax=Lentibacter algarum TaxID=576131 RepID=UPI001C087F24|nr:hypothetical protein [Lentibacter algarum]MBU2982407.1 hypothetical protein [Lentibacter algarum]
MSYRISLGVTALLMLASCDAGHLGNPLLLPVSGLTTGIENASYNTRRKKVSDYVLMHHAALMQEALASGGPHLTEAYALARVAPARHAVLTKRIATDQALYRQDAEALTVALMVHGT